MKKLIYTGAFALFAMGFVACAEVEDEVNDAMDEVEITEESVSEETTNELNQALDLQDEAEQLDDELSEYLETLIIFRHENIYHIRCTNCFNGSICTNETRSNEG